MFHFWKPSRKNELQAGIALSPDRLAFALVNRCDPESHEIVDLASIACVDQHEQNQALTDLRKRHQLNKIPCTFILNPDQYAFIQIEAPNVETDELKSAVRWRIKDMLDFHIDDATIDAFSLPLSARQSAVQLMYVVAARSPLIQSVVDRLLAVDINLTAIDINELALHNLTTTQLENDQQVVAACYRLHDSFYIVISDKNQMYLCRHIDDYTVPGSEGELDYNQLALEIQRSLDYYESQYGKGAVAQLSVFSNRKNTPNPADYFQLPVVRADLDNLLPKLNEYSDDVIMHCLSALGGALRSEP